MFPPPPPLIAEQVIQKLVELLADETGGYNATVAAWAEAYKIETPWQLDFAPGLPCNVIIGDVDSDDVEATMPLASQLFGAVVLVISTSSDDNTSHANREKFRMFSGIVSAQVLTRLEWSKSAAARDVGELVNFQKYGNLAADALISIFNRAENQDIWNPNVAYNGDITVTRSKIAPTDQHWTQDLLARLTFGVRVPQH